MSSDSPGKSKPETKQHHRGIALCRYFQLLYTTHIVFEPSVMREWFETPGTTPGYVFTSAYCSETEVFGLRNVFSNLLHLGRFIIIAIALITLWTLLRAEVREQTHCTYEVIQTLFNLSENGLSMLSGKLRAGVRKSGAIYPPQSQKWL